MPQPNKVLSKRHDTITPAPIIFIPIGSAGGSCPILKLLMVNLAPQMFVVVRNLHRYHARPLGLRVESSGWFVKYEYGFIGHKRTSDRNALFQEEIKHLFRGESNNQSVIH
jgi:hypothetical protein